MGLKNHCHRRCIKCCGCITAVVLILAVATLALIFTVFHIKDPIMNLNSVKIDGWPQFPWTNLQRGKNLRIKADVSVKNPNGASFKYDNATSSLYYGGIIIGEAPTPAGIAGARRTVRLNVSFDAVIDEKIFSVPRLGNDLVSGTLPVNSYTRIDGEVSYFKIIKTRIVAKMNCTIVISIATKQINGQDCNHRVSL